MGNVEKMMKRLFNVDGVDFDNKMAAKQYRDMQNVNKGGCQVVSLGVDHRLFGVRRTGKTHSHNCRSGGHGNGFPAKKRR